MAAAAERVSRLPCQRCVRRLARPAELDKGHVISCDKLETRLLCGYCSRENHKCRDVCTFSAASLARFADSPGPCFLPCGCKTLGEDLRQVPREANGCQTPECFAPSQGSG